MHHSYHPIMKQYRIDQTFPNHHLILSTENKNTKWSASSITVITGSLDGSNTSSNGKGTPKVTTHGNQLIKYMLPT